MRHLYLSVQIFVFSLWIYKGRYGLINATKFKEDVVISASGVADSMFSDKEGTILPSSGYVSGKIKNGKSITIKISKKINKPVFCKQVVLKNLPSPNSSPLMGPSTFNVMTEELYNDHYAWTNGIEMLSFIPGEEEGGTWIIGNEPGVDSGFVYIKSNSESMVPVMLETQDDEWNWLLDNVWTPQPQLRAECKDETTKYSMEAGEQSYYNIEYFDPTTFEVMDSMLVPAITTSPLRISSIFPDFSQVSIWDKVRNEWITLEAVEHVCSFGDPSVVTDENGLSAIAHLVNEEHSGNREGGWRLTFKRGLETPEEDAKFKGKDEITIEYGNKGGKAGSSISILTSKAKKKYRQNVVSSMANVQKGDFVWLWYSHANGSDPRTNHSSSHIEVLLECIYLTESHAIFEAFYADRRDAMYQTVLSKDTDMVVMRRSETSVSFYDGSQPLTMHGAFNLGSDIIEYLRSYLDQKEGSFGDMSSCYLYHAAVSMPRPLVYAAEIVCVLIGSKPVTMIQYTSPSDNQWKFPLVQKLVRGIISAKHILGNDLDLDYHINKYGKDETLILYRSNRKYLANALAPFHEAQALHPVPYPDRDNPHPDWEKQIYWSWWNGYVLGYPERFINSYCETFHNGLTVEEKLEQAALAKVAVQEYFKANMTSSHDIPVVIKKGLDRPLSSKFWDILYDRAV